MNERNQAVALKFIEAMGTNDPVTAAECLAPDAFTLAKGFSKFAGVRKRETILATIGAFKELLPTGLRLSVTSLTAGDNRVVAECVGDALTADGTPYCNEYCFVFTFEAGKIKQVNEYFCTKLAEEVLWPLVEAKGGAI